MNAGSHAEREYAQRLIVANLRRSVFDADETGPSNASLAALEAAEKRLSELEDQAAAGERSHARILDAPAVPAQQFRVRGEATTGLAAKAWLRMSQIPTAIYHLLRWEDNPLLAIEVENFDSKPRRIRATSYLEGYSAKAIDSREVRSKGSETFLQLPVLFPARLRELNELSAASLNILVEDLDGSVELHQTRPVPLLARTTAPLSVRDPYTGRWNDLSPYFGAFVTPNAPAIQSFLRDVANWHPEGSLASYQQDADDVTAQVSAVISGLQALDIRYINSTLAFSPDEGTATQRVRLPSESLSNRSANCMDGTVLIASVLEAMSLSPAIVTVPGHAFVGWETDTGSEDWKFLETTIISSATFEDACAAAERNAQTYQRLREETGKESMFRLWPLRVLRASYRITPLE